IVAIIAFVWFVFRFADFVVPSLLSGIYSIIHYPLTIIMTALIIVYSAKDYERRSVVVLLIVIPITLLLDYLAIVTLSFSYFIIIFEPFLIAIMIFSSMALGFELKGILKSRISSGMITIVIPILLIATGAFGLLMELPGIISLLLYSGSDPLVTIGISVTVQSVLFLLIYIGSAAIELPRTPLYWVIFIGCAASLIIFNLLNLHSILLLAYLNIVMMIAFRFFGVVAATMNQTTQRYSAELGETDDPFKHLD
ncbi:MAG: hypothetical protein IH631_10995, partial [Candidatus Thorarchaeota archaeon]|nr:hypothetical protein [Candidatus Thorarchaeota archaeon]